MVRRTNQHSSHLATPFGCIDYSLTRSSRRRTMMIRIDSTGQVKASIPFYTSLKSLEDFMIKKAEWIMKRVHQQRERTCLTNTTLFRQGTEFLFLGKKYPLSVTQEEENLSQINPNSAPQLAKDFSSPAVFSGVNFDAMGWRIAIPFFLSSDHREQVVKEKLLQWYKREAQEILGARIFHFVRIMGVEPKRIAIRSPKRLWGSCHYRRQSINLNWKIIMAPMEVIDYVVVHELSHLLVPNHSRTFWNKVSQILPGYKENLKWLKDHAGEMMW